MGLWNHVLVIRFDNDTVETRNRAVFHCWKYALQGISIAVGRSRKIELDTYSGGDVPKASVTGSMAAFSLRRFSTHVAKKLFNALATSYGLLCNLPFSSASILFLRSSWRILLAFQLIKHVVPIVISVKCFQFILNNFQLTATFFGWILSPFLKQFFLLKDEIDRFIWSPLIDSLRVFERDNFRMVGTGCRCFSGDGSVIAHEVGIVCT